MLGQYMKLSGNPIVGNEVSCSLEVKANWEEEGTKPVTMPIDLTLLQQTLEETSYDWTAQYHAKISDIYQLATIILIAKKGEKRMIEIADFHTTMYGGYAFISDLTISAPDRQDITVDITFQGTGGLRISES